MRKRDFVLVLCIMFCVQYISTAFETALPLLLVQVWASEFLC